MKRLIIAIGIILGLVIFIIISTIKASSSEKIQKYDENGYEIRDEKIYELNELIEKHDINKIKTYLSSGMDINNYPLKNNKKNYKSATYYNVTPIGQACLSGTYEIVKLLHENGASLDSKTIPDGETLVRLALINFNHTEQIKILKYLIDNNADLNVVDNYNIIHIGAGIGRDENISEFKPESKRIINLMHIIAENKIDLSAEWPERIYVLYSAVYYNEIDIVKYVLESCDKSFDIDMVVEENSYDKLFNRATLLIIASKNNNYEMCNYLLSKGADKTKKDAYGKTALDYAKENSNQELIKILQ